MNLSTEEFKYYQRQISLKNHSESEQEMLKNARVLIIGCGGLGVAAIQYLTGVGIGTIGIIDGDEVNYHNLHRQVVYTIADVGKLKVDCIEKYALARNPFVKIEKRQEFLNYDHGDLISHYDLVLDCTDNFDVRYVINDLCILRRKPFIYGGVYESEGHVAIFNYLGGPSYRCLYSESPDPAIFPTCAENGILPFNPGMIGILQAQFAIKIITQQKLPMNGKLLLCDWDDYIMSAIKIRKKGENFEKSFLHQCIRANLKSLTWKESKLYSEDETVYIDVRSEDEYAQSNMNDLNIPLKYITQFANNKVSSQFFNDSILEDFIHKRVICYCQSGSRANKAANLLKKLGCDNIAYINENLHSRSTK